jgi:alkanesulfonate monooxygenase SsuD/methylene tetrahydromethanopterin reductase-like flavin-dependent oxidoreductase (luciferase family)
MAYYGVEPDSRQPMYLEALAIVRQALSSRKLTFHGKFYDYTDVPIELEPWQKPHPPLWVGANSPDGAAAAGTQGFNFVANTPTAQVRVLTDRYREAYQAAHPNATDTPLLGLGRFVILGNTDEEALSVARRAYPLWHAHFHHLFRQRGETAVHGDRPPHFDQIKDGGRGIAGSPATVVRMIREQIQESGTSYFVGQFAFGDLALAEVLRTIELFAREVMPALRDL